MNRLQRADKLTEKQELACELALQGKTHQQVADAIGISLSTLTKWREQPVFEQALTAARATALDVSVDEMLEIRDATKFPDVRRAEAWTRAVQWVAARRNRAVYGDRLDVDVNVSVDIAGALQEARARLLRPTCDPAQIEDAEYTVESEPCESGSGDNQSLPRLPAIEDQPQPDVFS